MDLNKRCLGCMEYKGNAVICPHCKLVEGSTLDSALNLIPGTILQDKYLIGRALGQGGFGITYLAWDINLNLKRAIKEYMPLDLAYRTAGQQEVSVYKKSYADNFNYGLGKYLEEAQALAKLNENPNTVTVHDFFKANGTAYMVMDFIDGATLKSYLESLEGPLTFEEALNIFMPVIDALKEVHNIGILHRDISPDNILISKRGRIVLIDFGAARQAISDRSMSLSVVMKAGYTPEEQYHSRGVQGPWTDVYALAASMYRAITGVVPLEALSRLSEDTILPPSELGAEIDDFSEKILVKAMSVLAKNRYQTVEAFQKDLIDRTSLDKSILSTRKVVLEQKKYIAQEKKITSIAVKDTTSFDEKVTQANEQHNLVDFLKKNQWLAIALLMLLIIFAINSASINLTREQTFETGAFIGQEMDNSFMDEPENGSETVPDPVDEPEPEPETEPETTAETDRDPMFEPVIQRGVIYYLDGIYSGEYYISNVTDTIPHGKGTLEQEGMIFRGNWVQGALHGEGEILWANGQRYVGDVALFLRWGYGATYFPDGKQYVGQYESNKKHGEGTMFFENGGKYEGEWKDGFFHGQGTYTFADGTIWIGRWENGEYIGP